jgi:hypothetical protein
VDFCRGAYEKSTLIRYDQDTKYWIEFINSNGLHKFLWGLSKQEKVIEMVRFIRELVITSHRSGDQVTRILSAMASLFRTHCQDIASVMESDSVKLARKAAAKQESARAISEKTGTGYTIDVSRSKSVVLEDGKTYSHSDRVGPINDLHRPDVGISLYVEGVRIHLR